jgi:predicted Fe-Mo cluster-binding NifX family protein
MLETNMPKIAISVVKEGWDAPVDARFGRAAGFAIVALDGDNRSLAYLPNVQNRQAAQGAGIQAAETVASAGAKVLLTGHVGPKAFRALKAAGIAMYTGITGSVEDALQAYADGSLNEAKDADVEGHW